MVASSLIPHMVATGRRLIFLRFEGLIEITIGSIPMDNYKILHPECVLAFVALGEEGSFTAAAAALRVSHSVVSERIKKLETYVNAQLVLRTTRSMSLTPAGEKFLQACRRIIDEYRDAVAVVRSDHEYPHGLLRIAAPDYLILHYLTESAVAFAGQYAEVTFDLMATENHIDLLASRVDIDIRVGQPRDSSLHAVKLADCRQSLVASRDYLTRHDRICTPQDLLEHSLIAHETSAQSWHWVFSRPGDKDEKVLVKGRLRANSTSIMRNLALAGGGVTELPDFLVADDLAAGRLVHVLPEWNLSAGGIYAIYPSRKHLPARVRLFIALLREQFGAAPAFKRRLLGAMAASALN